MKNINNPQRNLLMLTYGDYEIFLAGYHPLSLETFLAGTLN